jgi:hypothetical protein
VTVVVAEAINDLAVIVTTIAVFVSAIYVNIPVF